MPFSERLSSTDLQTSALSRRDLLVKSSAIAVAAAKLVPQFSVPKAYPVPQFNIGDLVASDWVDEFDQDATDFGEVLGVRWLPEAQSIYPAKIWVYYIYWTHSTCGSLSCYPCYDGEPSAASELTLVSRA